MKESTTHVEEEQADRFGPARSSGIVLWSKQLGEIVKKIEYDEQSNTEQPNQEEESKQTNIDAIFNR